MSFAVTNFSCHRGTRAIIAGLSFKMELGQVRVLRGPNGAGKSTLLRALAGLLRSQSGEVTLNGVSRQNHDEYQDLITYAGHLDAIKPQLSVRENLRFWSDLFASEVFEQTMEDFRLSEIADRLAHTCSAGQKRRLGLARIAVTSRPLLLLDEPTVSLDLATTRQFANFIDRHCEAGGMAIIATHIDLGLTNSTDLNLIEMTNETRNSLPETDPFLTGDWA